jgi:regulatory protein
MVKYDVTPLRKLNNMGKITSITRQVKNKNRVSIFVDEEYFGALDEKTFMESGLKSGDEICEKKWQELYSQAENQSAFNKAIAYISKLMRSEKQVKEYLEKKGYEQTAIDYAVDKLREYKYLDDDAYAKMILSHQMNVKKSGEMAVREAFRKNGIPREIADAALEEYLPEQQIENAKQQYQKLFKKYQREQDSYKRKNKIAQAMARRGFNWETIKSVSSFFEEEN